MTDKELLDCRFNRNAILFKIISRCNDSCIFCTEYDNMHLAKEDLSFEEIKQNYEFLKNRLGIDYVILSGGEPTLHPNIFKIIDYFKAQGTVFKVITNAIKLNDENVLLNYKKAFSGFNDREQERSSTSIISINDLSGCSINARRRIDGLKKAMSVNLPLMITVVIYKDNYLHLQEIAKTLKYIYKEYGFYNNLYIELRLAYIKNIELSSVRKYVSENFFKLKENVKKALSVLDISGVNLILWNFPFCYLGGSFKPGRISARLRLKRRYIKISKEFQFDDAKVRNWEFYLKNYDECNFCKFKEDCGGIEYDYIKKLNFPNLKTRLLI